MEEEHISYSEAEKIIKDKLKEIGLKVEVNKEGDYTHYVEDTKLDISPFMFGHNPSYEFVNITLYGIGVNTRRMVRDFNIIIGNYSKLKDKILELSEISRQHKIFREKEDKENRKEYNLLIKELKELGISVRVDDDSSIFKEVHADISMTASLTISKDKDGFMIDYMSLPEFKHLKILKEDLMPLINKIKDLDNFLNKIFQEEKI